MNKKTLTIIFTLFCITLKVDAQDQLNNSLNPVEMPSFPGCENEKEKFSKKPTERNKSELKNCRYMAMLKFIYDNIKYPELARTEGIEGDVITKFTVQEDGSITNGEVVEGVGFGLDEEAIRVIELMPSFEPAKNKHGEVVESKMTLPIKFRL